MTNKRGGTTVDIYPENYEKIKKICYPQGMKYEQYINRVLAKHFEALHKKGSKV